MVYVQEEKKIMEVFFFSVFGTVGVWINKNSALFLRFNCKNSTTDKRERDMWLVRSAIFIIDLKRRLFLLISRTNSAKYDHEREELKQGELRWPHSHARVVLCMGHQ